MHAHHHALGVALSLRPSRPVMLLRPHAAEAAARYFVRHFPGRSFYAVKANPDALLLRHLWAGGIRQFDVASLAEARLVRGLLPQSELAFMHPVKAEEAIHEAYHRLGVRIFALDSPEELAKIVRATARADGTPAGDLALCVRLRVSSAHSKLSLGAKFGIGVAEAPALLMAARQVADTLGICFHVGSQAMSPQAYADALAYVRAAIVASGVTVDVIDVGGGFPSRYPGLEPPPLGAYFAVIERGFEALPVSYSAELWCEPGRALAADFAGLLVRVEKRRGHELFINDGAYGSLFDAAHLGWRYPVRLVRPEPSTAPLAEFTLWGPTCDDMDHMKGPFPLPADVGPGDYLEFGQIGAYGQAMRTDFNGFGEHEVAIVADPPLASLIPVEAAEAAAAATRLSA
ncbi:MAG: type III PLP-dependent enzyme [Sphingomonadaceae bacterium]|uniref:type III PLP-dependent enzyme n=1 Tax=Thermaurantiacus sp. TaxID=2820283 RepID=UPI00298EE4D0|nr:type III PLP-dependent enzyme [Thermaurantiacus sp.]MCS6986755.1 type III PLP-dependent enzyme [Sphingomonadaceae bacterium]MDW8413982.1 type III PLP-dependent enzyme [Thermaurantiacus sp.]